MKAKLVKVVITASVLMMVMVGCGQKEVSVSPTNVVEENSEDEISEGVQENTKEQQEASASEFEFEEQDGEMALVKYNGSATSVTVPDSYNGKNITIIGDRAFSQNETIEEVILPNTIITIGEASFMMCKNLNKVVLGKNTKIIEKEAFLMCYSLVEIEIPEQIEKMGKDAFCNTAVKSVPLFDKLEELEEGVLAVSEIQKVIISGNVKAIGERAFEACKNLKEVEIQEGVEIIADEAFGDCDILDTVIIPRSVTEINEYAFMFSGNNLTIIAPEGSYAQQYAAEQEITFQAQ